MPISMPPTLTPEASAIRVPEGLGTEMQALVAELYPICRSITGNGVRETLRILGRLVPLQVTEVPSGTPVLDWTVPDEWNIREAWIADATGQGLAAVVEVVRPGSVLDADEALLFGLVHEVQRPGPATVTPLHPRG